VTISSGATWPVSFSLGRNTSCVPVSFPDFGGPYASAVEPIFWWLEMERDILDLVVAGSRIGLLIRISIRSVEQRPTIGWLEGVKTLEKVVRPFP
jgi:hypothetical protein